MTSPAASSPSVSASSHRSVARSAAITAGVPAFGEGARSGSSVQRADRLFEAASALLVAREHVVALVRGAEQDGISRLGQAAGQLHGLLQRPGPAGPVAGEALLELVGARAQEDDRPRLRA